MLNDPLQNRIDALLADEQYVDHPLREALSALFQEYNNQQSKVGRLASISDGYSKITRDDKTSLEENYRKQQRQLAKIAKISDRYQVMLQEKNDELHSASTQDQLTDIPNRRLMQDRINAAAELAKKRGSVFSLALVDVDNFKSINDQFGHDIGDQVLIQIAQSLKGSIRGHDICARWGGEEFMLLLPGTPGSQALMVAERVRREVEELELSFSIKVSISIGIAEHQLSDISSETITRADQALYLAKRNGKNKVELA